MNDFDEKSPREESDYEAAQHADSLERQRQVLDDLSRLYEYAWMYSDLNDEVGAKHKCRESAGNIAAELGLLSEWKRMVG